MVVVRVGDEDGFELAGLIDRHGAEEVSDAPSEQRIGQQPRAVELDENGRVPEVPNGAHADILSAL